MWLWAFTSYFGPLEAFTQSIVARPHRAVLILCCLYPPLFREQNVEAKGLAAAGEPFVYQLLDFLRESLQKMNALVRPRVCSSAYGFDVFPLRTVLVGCQQSGFVIMKQAEEEAARREQAEREAAAEQRRQEAARQEQEVKRPCEVVP